MGSLAETDVSAWLRQAWPSLVWLLVAAGVAFAIGLLLRYRRDKIQKQYQSRVEQQKQADSGEGPSGE